MGFRFRKTLRLMPGVRINLSKSGISASLGPHGATTNIGENGVRETVGLPGSGMSYSEMLTGPGGSAPKRPGMVVRLLSRLFGGPTP